MRRTNFGSFRQVLFAILLSMLPFSAHAFVFGDVMAKVANALILQLTSIITMLAMAFLTVMVVAIPIVADFGLVLGAIFLPLAIAVWPITKSWATAAFGTIIASAMTGVASAFFISLLLKEGGAMQMAINKANEAMADARGIDTVGVVFSASFGLIIFSLIAILAAFSITGVVSRIFGGATIDGARMAAGGMIAGAGAAMGAAGFAARAVEGGLRGAGAGAADAKQAGLTGKQAMKQVLAGAFGGTLAATRSRDRQAMLDRIKASAPKSP